MPISLEWLFAIDVIFLRKISLNSAGNFTLFRFAFVQLLVCILDLTSVWKTSVAVLALLCCNNCNCNKGTHRSLGRCCLFQPVAGLVSTLESILWLSARPKLRFTPAMAMLKAGKLILPSALSCMLAGETAVTFESFLCRRC